jgi:hypothetical protein
MGKTAFSSFGKCREIQAASCPDLYKESRLARQFAMQKRL